MIEFARVFFNIALLRRGPQDLPASVFLFVLLIGIAFLLNLAVAAGFGFDLLLTVERETLATGLGLTLTLAILSIAGRRQRFLQTAIALLGTALLLAPIDVVLLGIASAIGSLTDPPDWIRVIEGLNVAWGVVIGGHVYRCALERNFLICVVLALACEIMALSAVESLFPLKP
jgi:hypothetical protein